MKPAGASGTMGEKASRKQESTEGVNVPPHLSCTHGSWAPRQSVSSQISCFTLFFFFFTPMSFKCLGPHVHCLHRGIPPQMVLRCQAEEIQSVSTMDFASLFQKLQHRCLISRNTKACVPGQAKPVPALTSGLVRFFSSVPLLASVCHGEWAVG